MGFSTLKASKDQFMTYLSCSEYSRICRRLHCIDASSGEAWRHIGALEPILRFAVSGGKSID